MTHKPLLLAASALLALATLSAHAADPDDLVKYRQNVMNANGGLMGASNALIQNKVPFKEELAANAKALEALNKDLPALFPKGSNVGDTEALPDVWTKRAEFERRAKEAQAKAASFAKAAADKDPKLAEKFKDLSDACKSCHKDFRK